MYIHLSVCVPPQRGDMAGDAEQHLFFPHPHVLPARLRLNRSVNGMHRTPRASGSASIQWLFFHASAKSSVHYRHSIILSVRISIFLDVRVFSVCFFSKLSHRVIKIIKNNPELRVDDLQLFLPAKHA